MIIRKIVQATALAALATVSAGSFSAAVAQEGATAAQPVKKDMAKPTAEMKEVLDKLTELGAKPIGTLSVEETRAQPTPADAVMGVMVAKNVKLDPALAAVKTEDMMIPGAGGEIPVRIYTPEGEGPFPVVVYYHGGGWVIANIDTYDASARALASGAEAIVVSAHYRQAPENKFPAAHEDAFAAYEWAVENSGSFNGDANRMAVAGESAGGNLAANVAIMARDAKVTTPVHQLLVYPVAGKEMTTPSYKENEKAMPLSKSALAWFFTNVLESMDQASDKRLDLVSRDDLSGLPAATVINAEIDPLRSEGETLAANLEKAGVAVEQKTYPGLAHEFFGMGAVVPEAKAANEFAAAALKRAFEAVDTSSTSSTAN